MNTQYFEDVIKSARVVKRELLEWIVYKEIMVFPVNYDSLDRIIVAQASVLGDYEREDEITNGLEEELTIRLLSEIGMDARTEVATIWMNELMDVLAPACQRVREGIVLCSQIIGSDRLTIEERNNTDRENAFLTQILVDFHLWGGVIARFLEKNTPTIYSLRKSEIEVLFKSNRNQRADVSVSVSVSENKGPIVNQEQKVASSEIGSLGGLTSFVLALTFGIRYTYCNWVSSRQDIINRLSNDPATASKGSDTYNIFNAYLKTLERRQRAIRERVSDKLPMLEKEHYEIAMRYLDSIGDFWASEKAKQEMIKLLRP